MRIEAIKATRAPIGTDGIQQLIEGYLGAHGFAGAMISRMADYPAQQPTTYRRTGTLGRNWRMVGPRTTPKGIEVVAENKTEYAVFVEGPKTGSKGRRQTTVMRNKHWKNITDETRTEWVTGGHRLRIVRVLTQQDSTIRNRRRRF